MLRATLQRWDTRQSLLNTFHVDRQMELTKSSARCHFTNAPTLWTANQAYGYGTAQEWLIYQITDLSEFSGARAKLTDRQIDQVVQLITDDYGYLNMAEIMLFCRRFKSGAYDKFYGTVDPIAIMQGLAEFCKERVSAWAKREALQRAEKRERELHNPNNMSREEYDIIDQVRREYAMNTVEQDRLTEQKYNKRKNEQRQWQTSKT